MSSLNTCLENYKKWLELASLDTKSYQMEGITFLLNKELSLHPYMDAKGGILADEMGLGKTIQMLGLVYSHFVPKTLIVMPRALIDQWETEIIKLFGHRPLIFHNNRKHEKNIEDSPIVITTYGTLSQHILTLKNIKWDRVIYDEAHHLRNKKTKSFKSAREIKPTYQWFVTGTPIQNSLYEMYSYTDLLGINIEYVQDNMKEVIENIVIKRTKKQVNIELPDIYYHNINVPWKDVDEKLFSKELHSTINFSNITLSNVNILIKLLTKHHLPALLRMRQMCILPSIIKNTEEFSNLDLMSHFCRSGVEGTSKMETILDTLGEKKDNGNKKIIFSQFTEEIMYLYTHLSEMGYNVQYVDGSVKQSKRDNIFNDNTIDVLILQIKSCSEGLNLQRYNEIYFTSPHWNPYVEDQAIARAHRIGQKRDVHVYRFYMEGFGVQSTNENKQQDHRGSTSSEPLDFNEASPLQNDNKEKSTPIQTLSIEQYCKLIQEKKRELDKLFD
jgi:SNF2 family DNA or RNA helicase